MQTSHCLQVLVNDSLCYELLPFICGPCIDSTVQMGSGKPRQEASQKVWSHLWKLYYKLVCVDIIVDERII